MGYTQGEISPHNGVEGQGHLRVGWQGEYVIRNLFAIRAPVGSHKVPNRKGVIIIGKSRCGRGVLGFALAHALVLGLSFGTDHCSSSVYCPWGTVNNPILSPPCLKPSWSPFHFPTMWTCLPLVSVVSS